MKIGTDFEAYFQSSPNVVVLRGHKQHVVVTSRCGEVHDFMLEDAAEVARLCAKYEAEGYASHVRLRNYWGDNSHGNGRASVHVIVSSEKQKGVASRFEWPSTTKNGQTLDVDVRETEESTGSDRFEANDEAFYEAGRGGT